MTPTPLDAKPQGAQLKRYTPTSSHGGMSECVHGGEYVKYAEAAERIEKLEREIVGVLKNIPNSVRVREGGADENIAASLAVSVAMLVQERDTALRALAEARRDAAELRKIAERMLGWHNAPHDCYSTGPVHGDARDASCPSCELVSFLKHIDSARQPEKDANNG